MQNDVAFDTLLSDLYGGLVEPDRLDHFLGALADATGSHIGALVEQDVKYQTANIPHIIGTDRQSALRYEAEYAGENVWLQRSMSSVRGGATLLSDDWISPAELRQTRYYADYLRTIDVGHSIGIFGEASRDRIIMLTLACCERHGGYDSVSRHLCERVAPHFVNACAVRAQLDSLRSELAHAIGNGRGLFLLDADLRWTGGNAAAEAMVAAGWWRGHRGTHLVACSAATRAAWHALTREIVYEPCPHAILVRDGHERLVAFARLHALAAVAPQTTLPSYLLMVRPVQIPIADAAQQQLCDLFALTAAEAALAIAMRIHGDLAHAATSLGIAECSARTRLQVVFDKMNVHRQTDMLQVLEAFVDVLQ